MAEGHAVARWSPEVVGNIYDSLVQLLSPICLVLYCPPGIYRGGLGFFSYISSPSRPMGPPRPRFARELV
ncbi:hypothetical protein C1H46_019175 [Malus baccata]|uniref:Uncharacterized protein n=1 Tax=Malus baccata TaxID=106549 RepID=A0A540M8Y9_MALBA|nr:hypothetical protein C1H46_019175 [Malus baccata]